MLKGVNVKRCNNKYILGSRCMRNLDMPDNIYCHQHIQHLTHGNYNDMQMLKCVFILLKMVNIY